MALETVVLAVGPGDAERIDRLAEETIDIAGPADATVVLGHVFTDEEYEPSRASTSMTRDRPRRTR